MFHKQKIEISISHNKPPREYLNMALSVSQDCLIGISIIVVKIGAVRSAVHGSAVQSTCQLSKQSRLVLQVLIHIYIYIPPHSFHKTVIKSKKKVFF